MSIKKYIQVYSHFAYSSISIELEYKINLLIDFLTSILGLIGSVFLLFLRNYGKLEQKSSLLWVYEYKKIFTSLFTF